MKIILAVDGSKNSEWAVDLLLKLPWAEELQISVLLVVHQRKHIPPFIDSMHSKQYKDAMQEKINKDLATAEKLTTQIVDRLRIRWNEVKPIIEKGHVADKIIEKAREEHADLVILGSRGLSRFKNLLLGGVSQKVATYVPCSVLVVKKKIRNFKKILVAIDGSSYSETAVSFVKSHFLPEGVSITFLNVWDYPVMLPKFPFETIEKKYSKEMRKAAFMAHALCVSGDPAEMIANTSHRKKVDLVVVGSKGLTGIKQFFLGSVARKVITHSKCSVLVVKSIDKINLN